MSLYFDAVSILTSPRDAGGSLKSRIYNTNTNSQLKSKLKSAPAQIYALIAEVSKWNTVIKEVVDGSEILKHEPKVGPYILQTFVHV